MAQLNYQQAVPRPEYGWKPSGFLAGANYQEDRDRYTDMAQIQDLMSMYGLAQQMGEYGDYQANAPVRQAERGQKISAADLASLLNKMKTNPRYAEGMMRGELGEAGSKQAAGQIAMETAPGKISETNIANKKKETEAAIRLIDFALPQLQQIGSQTQNPLQQGMAYQQFKNQLPPQVQQYFPPQYDQRLVPHMAQLRERLIQSPELQQDLIKQREKDVAHMDRTKEETKRAISVTAMNIKAAKERAELSSEDKQRVKKDEEFLVSLESQWLNRAPTQTELDTYQRVQQRMLNLYAAKAAGAALPYQWMGQSPGAGQIKPQVPPPVLGPGREHARQPTKEEIERVPGWSPHDPNKYTYGYENGRLYREAK